VPCALRPAPCSYHGPWMARANVPANWPELPDEQLLDLRLADLPLKLEGTVIEGRLTQLRSELEARELKFPLHFYISDEWFTPDGTATMAVPFYMTHPRLERLEKSQMLEVEGGEHEWCMRILRHEAGHVIDNAYKLRLRQQRRALFGRSNEPYPEFYDPKPYSKAFVQHIDPWYAQSHPDEDFAETFAVWLTPDANWRQRYSGWPAVNKLEYMETLHYRRKRRHHGIDHPKFYDRELRRLFSDAPEFSGNMTAAQFLGKMRQPVRRVVASWTGIYQYTIDKVLEDMITRCRELKLRLAVPEEQARSEFAVLLTVQTMNYLHSGRHRVAL